MKKIPEMKKPKGKSESIKLNYLDGQSREVYLTDEEYRLGSKMIFSTADLKGNIIKVNDAFIEASGWTEEELIGQPHCMLRHPHMPKSAFKDMWEKLQSVGNWHGYVKNLRKDGGYYWVHAIVHTTKVEGEIVGYQSARHKIKDNHKEEYEALYAEERKNDK